MKKLLLSALLLTAQYAVSLNSNPLRHRAALGHGTPMAFNAGAPVSERPLEIERHRVWLNLTNPEGLFKQLLVGYMTGATNGFDFNYDALSVDANKYADFYSINEGKKLVIQGRGLPFDPSDIIELGYRSAIVGNLTISIDHADGDLTQKDIYLQDKTTGTIHNLKNGSYTFYTKTGIFNDRFVLRYAPEGKLGLDDLKNNQPQFYVSVKDRVISINSENATLKDATVFDINGKILYNRQNTDTYHLEITCIQANAQVLLVQATLEDGHTITRKVLF